MQPHIWGIEVPLTLLSSFFLNSLYNIRKQPEENISKNPPQHGYLKFSSTMAWGDSNSDTRNKARKENMLKVCLLGQKTSQFHWYTYRQRMNNQLANCILTKSLPSFVVHLIINLALHFDAPNMLLGKSYPQRLFNSTRLTEKWMESDILEATILADKIS